MLTTVISKDNYTDRLSLRCFDVEFSKKHHQVILTTRCHIWCHNWRLNSDPVRVDRLQNSDPGRNRNQCILLWKGII